MKLLLTSSGFTNQSIIDALQKLVDKPFSKLNLAFIPTAADIEESDKSWLIDDLSITKNLGFKRIDIVNIAAMSQKIWLPRLEHADIIMFCGGNSFHLMYSIRQSGLDKLLPKLLETRVYVGISAGSIAATQNLKLSSPFKKEFTQQIGEDVTDEALKLVDFIMRPHLNNGHFPHARLEYIEKLAETMPETIYAIDDETAIMVDNGRVSIISEGKWKKFH